MAATIRHTVADNICRLAAARGLDDDALMSALSVDERTLRLIKIGARALFVDDVARLASVFGVSIVDLLVAPESGPIDWAGKA
jgi:hypothetical protein